MEVSIDRQCRKIVELSRFQGKDAQYVRTGALTTENISCFFKRFSISRRKIWYNLGHRPKRIEIWRLYAETTTRNGDGRIRYIQVAVSVADEAKLKQELAVFASIQDNHPKYLMTLDEIFVADHAGIRTLNVIDFLLGRQAFD